MSLKVKGNLNSLKPSELKAIEKLFHRRIDANQIINSIVAKEVALLSKSLKRIIGLLINRRGDVVEVFVGTHNIIYLPTLDKYDLSSGRLRGLRFIFTDLSKAEFVKIPKDIQSDLTLLRLDLVLGIKVIDDKLFIKKAYNLPEVVNNKYIQEVEIKDSYAFLKEFQFIDFINNLSSEFSKQSQVKKIDSKRSAIIVGVYDNKSKFKSKESILELNELARTAGIKIVDQVIQYRVPDPKTIVGKGKLEEIVLFAQSLGVELLIFDTEILPRQWRVITDLTDLKVIDRSMLILDIFALRATSRDGKAQVELAQLKYNLPRLVEAGKGLSRLTGGIGGRGPGETKIEVNRRRARDRISKLEKNLKDIDTRRDMQRVKRQAKPVPLVAILGYTNVGKSTLFNKLTKSNVIVENKLFATLEPYQRKMFLGQAENGVPKNVIVSDTVGFIRDLPDELYQAFKATLEEIRSASLLIHVVDASDPDPFRLYDSVIKILKELKIEIDIYTVFNKIDLVDIDLATELNSKIENSFLVSAIKGTGVQSLREKIKDFIYP